MDDPAQMEIIEAYEVKPLTARTAAEKICKGLMDLSESYSKDGYEMLANGVFTIASALQSTINDGEFGVE
jgi:hypothetical protein